MTNRRFPGVAYSVTVRADYANSPGMLGQISTAIGEVGGDITGVEMVQSSREVILRDITINARDVDHGQEASPGGRRCMHGLERVRRLS